MSGEDGGTVLMFDHLLEVTPVLSQPVSRNQQNRTDKVLLEQVRLDMNALSLPSSSMSSPF